jgi:uracil-DNA glycosylase
VTHECYRSITTLQRDLRACRLCAEAGYPLDPAPVVARYTAQRAYLLGLAPGIVERERGRPWQGRAGATLRRWLRLDEDALTSAFYCASVTRCFPGRTPSGRGDRPATAAEQALCERWWRTELELLQPELIVTIGGLAARRLLGVTRLIDAVGKSYVHGDAIVVPLPHPSGASGWLNVDANRARLGKALVHVRRELASLESPGR